MNWFFGTIFVIWGLVVFTLSGSALDDLTGCAMVIGGIAGYFWTDEKDFGGF